MIRTVSRIIPASKTYEGEGFLVHRPFPGRELVDFDPFLLLDEMGPMDVRPGEAKGAPDHPHKGFETVTYMLSGNFEHKDSHGHSGKLAPGDVQWMTAGSGIVHSEIPASEFQRTGGRLHGLQLWVNLPKRDKLIEPHYQEIPAAQIPSAATPDGLVKVRVIAGESLGTRAAIATRIPILYLHFTIAPGASVIQAVPRDYNAFAYVLEGGAAIAGTTVASDETSAPIHTAGRHHMILLAQDGDEVQINAAAGSEPLQILLIGGVPLNEPVARWGPFVMNTRAEIMQAMDDYQKGKMGSIEH